MKIVLFTPHVSQQNRNYGSLKSFLLVMAMLLVAASNAFAQATYETIDGIRYLIDSDAKTATVMPLSDGQKYSGDVVVPEKVKTQDGVECEVVALGDKCFAKCKSLISVTIPNSVERLADYSFYYCESLSSVNIPNSVKKIGSYCFELCNSLKEIYFQSEQPVGASASIPTSCLIYVPQKALQTYKDYFGTDYLYIYPYEFKKEDCGALEQCTIPTIKYIDGKLRFYSSTDGAQYHYTIADADIVKDAYSAEGEITLYATYNISVYATADGYKASEKATAVLYWVKANATLEDGTSTNIYQAKMRGIVATSRNGIVTLSGLDAGEEVHFYTVDGKQVGVAKTIDGVASLAVPSASLIIAKIGSLTIKIAVK